MGFYIVASMRIQVDMYVTYYSLRTEFAYSA